MGLSQQTCKPCEGGMPPLDPARAGQLLAQVPGWEVAKDSKQIQRLFSFENYWAGVGFCNAVAWIAQQEKHHPDIELGYKKVMVKYSTHAVGGLSENDFICAAKINELISK